MAGNVYSFDDMARYYREHERPVSEAVATIRRTVKLWGPRRVQEVTSALAPRAPVDRGTYRRSWHVDDIPTGAALYNSAAWASVIELGRRAGAKAPPLRVIIEWVARKKLAGDRGASHAVRSQDAEVRRVAFLIMMAIKRRGIKGRHVLQIASRMLYGDVRRALVAGANKGA